MVSLKEKYTDLYYVDQAELYEQLPVSGIDAIWEEICHYRRMFQVTYQFNAYRFTYSLTPAIYQSMIDTERSLRCYQLAFKAMNMNSALFDDKQYIYLLSELIDSRFCDTISLNQLATTHPLLFCVLIHGLKLKEENNLVELCLNRWGLNAIQEEIKEILNHLPNRNELDQTIILITFLKRLKGVINEVMLQAKLQRSNALLNECYESLIYTYPMLAPHSIDFFVKHREWGYYYRVNDYIKAENCSYETARSALNELVSLGWYKKIKVGKKFVYCL